MRGIIAQRDVGRIDCQRVLVFQDVIVSPAWIEAVHILQFDFSGRPLFAQPGLSGCRTDAEGSA
jgi:hypothetical protein